MHEKPDMSETIRTSPQKPDIVLPRYEDTNKMPEFCALLEFKQTTLSPHLRPNVLFRALGPIQQTLQL